MKKSLLVTGGTGYIGSHTVVELIKQGYEIIILDNLSNSDVSVLKNIEKITHYTPKFYEGDIRNTEILSTIFLENSIDCVIHFAGLKAVGESCENVGLYHDNNISGSVCLFEVMQKHNVHNIIFSSSATVYSPNNSMPLSENDPTGQTTNPYGTSKLLVEELLRDYALHQKRNVINLRYFNPIGAHPSGLIGENPHGTPNNLLPYIMKVATGELKQVGVFGDSYPTDDGTGVRDYIDVTDLAKGHLKAYEFLKKQNQGCFEVCNLGVGKGVSVLEMIDLVASVTKQEIPYSIQNKRKGDLPEVYSNPTKAHTLLDRNAKVGIEESIYNAWKFCIKEK